MTGLVASDATGVDVHAFFLFNDDRIIVLLQTVLLLKVRKREVLAVSSWSAGCTALLSPGR